jgi:hypothetical protein
LFGQNNECEKCDIKKLKLVYDSLENLSYPIVYDFVCTLDSSCKNNVEFSEWSNELTFRLVEKNANLLNKVMHDLGFNYVLMVCNELSSPLMDYDYQKLYNQVKSSSGPKDMIYEQKKALIEAANHEGLTIKE